MRTLARVMLTACVLAGGVLVSACDTLENFEIWDTKKKLPGERKPVFPTGVPGVTQGVPPEYLPGYQDPSAQAAQPAQPGQQPGQPGQPARSAAAEPNAGAAGEGAPPPQAEKPKPKPKRTAVVRKPPPAQAQPAQAQPVQAQPVQTAQPQQAQPPYGQSAAWPSAQPQGTWPSAPASGTFSR